jgi:inosose dehydratase
MNADLSHVRIGANPIIWSNDDFQDLGGDIPLERCLEEMHQAGYSGTELGHKYPRQAPALRNLLERFDLQLVSGWHSLYLLDNAVEDERQRFATHRDFLRDMGSTVVIVAECSHRCYNQPGAPLQFEGRQDLLKDDDWQRLCRGLDMLADDAARCGMKMVYHHHMGTVVQNGDEIDRLLQGTSALRLLADTGHLVFAGVDPQDVFRRHASRIAHVHLKDVRQEVVDDICSQRGSFDVAVRNGVFTVPGDGSIDFAPVFATLQEMQYEGWLVVEAEQDPDLSPPLLYAARGREYLRRCLGI